MKPYTWKEIVEASKEEKQFIVETYGLLGAVAIELAGALGVLEGQDTPGRNDCAVHQVLGGKIGYGAYLGSCSKCPLKSVPCGYFGEGKANLINLYYELYHERHVKK